MNRAKKGSDRERQIRKILADNGWRIMFKSVRTAYGTYDFGGAGKEHGLFDVVAYRGLERVYISSKHFGQGNYYKPHQKEIRDFGREYGKEGESYELWIWVSPRWTGRGSKKKWTRAHFKKLVLWSSSP